MNDHVSTAASDIRFEVCHVQSIGHPLINESMINKARDSR